MDVTEYRREEREEEKDRDEEDEVLKLNLKHCKKWKALWLSLLKLTYRAPLEAQSEEITVCKCCQKDVFMQLRL